MSVIGHCETTELTGWWLYAVWGAMALAAVFALFCVAFLIREAIICPILEKRR